MFGSTRGPTPRGKPAQGLRSGSARPAGDNWLTHGRTYDEQRYSPLTQINRDTVKDLGLAWYADFETQRGHFIEIIERR